MSESQFSAVGKRKASVARVILRQGNGKISINGREVADYFPRATLMIMLKEPLDVTDTVGSFDISIKVRGGGLVGQAGAIRLGIARALLKVDESHQPTLRKKGLLTRDSRIKERKKYGQKGARAGFQRSKR